MLMTHKITGCVVEVAVPSRFGQSEAYHGQYNRPGHRERTTTSTWICTNGRVGSHLGGTCILLWVTVEQAGDSNLFVHVVARIAAASDLAKRRHSPNLQEATDLSS